MKKVTICLIGLGLLLALPQVLMAKGKPSSGGCPDNFSCGDIKVQLKQGITMETSVGIEAASAWHGPYPIENGAEHHPWTSADWSWDEGGAFFFDNWDANDLLRVPRPCHYTTVGALPSTGGRYDCFEGGGETWPHGGRVSIDLKGMHWSPATAGEPRKGWKDDRFCDLLNDNFGYLSFGVTRYQVYFMDGCDDDACDISMRANSYSGAWTAGVENADLVQLHPFHDLEGYPDIGILSVSGWTHNLTVNSLNPPAENELNVFSVKQDIPIDELTVDFNAVSNGALQVTCTTGNPTGVWLHTEPQ